MDHLYAINALCDYFKTKKLTNLVVVSPDVGGIKMARAYAKRLDAGLAIVDKRRSSPDKTEVMHILGNVKGKNAILVDDIIATGGSIVEAVGALTKEGVKDVYAAVSHGILSGPAIEAHRGLQGVKRSGHYGQHSVRQAEEDLQNQGGDDSAFAREAIHRIHDEESISCLFDETRQ